MNVYAAGALVKLEWVFRNSDDDSLIDPSAVYLWVKDPDNTETSFTYGVGTKIVKDSTGTYYALLDTTGFEGMWVSRAYSTGTAQASTKEWEFETE